MGKKKIWSLREENVATQFDNQRMFQRRKDLLLGEDVLDLVRFDDVPLAHQLEGARRAPEEPLCPVAAPVRRPLRRPEPAVPDGHHRPVRALSCAKVKSCLLGSLLVRGGEEVNGYPPTVGKT